MSKCKYCSKDAGLLRFVHKECLDKRRLGEQGILEQSVNALSLGSNLQSLEESIKQIAASSFIEPVDVTNLLIKAFEQATDSTLQADVFNEEVEKSFSNFRRHFDIAQDLLDKRGAWTKLVKAFLLRDVIEGRIPQRVTLKGEVPFNFQKSELLVWFFQDIKFFEARTLRSYVGSSRGISLRVMKGVYYRQSEFRGYPIVKTDMAQIDRGAVALTSQHLYFSGQNKSFRIPYRKIVTFEPYKNGVKIHTDGINSKPRVFVTKDNWFFYNLLINLSHHSNA